MLYWYKDLMIDDKLKKKAAKHVQRVERYYRALPKSRIFSDKKRVWERIIGKKIPWKEYYVITRASNPNDLFDVMGTRQWIFRHYARNDIYVIGLYSSKDGALDSLKEVLITGYTEDPEYSPSQIYGKKDKYADYKLLFTADRE
ncbi:MAG: hypothetical protein J6P16_04060 [Eubacterium sp.]|nr:hypothetical protein [Eubacterium sp.]